MEIAVRIARYPFEGGARPANRVPARSHQPELRGGSPCDGDGRSGRRSNFRASAAGGRTAAEAAPMVGLRSAAGPLQACVRPERAKPWRCNRTATRGVGRCRLDRGSPRDPAAADVNVIHRPKGENCFRIRRGNPYQVTMISFIRVVQSSEVS